MKPTFPKIETSHRRDSQPARGGAHGLPQTDYDFRANSIDFSGRCYGSPAPSFRRISDDYFKNEATGHFVSEAAMFCLMLVTAAVPVIEGVRVATHFLRATGVL
jgi:hypothetical protein